MKYSKRTVEAAYMAISDAALNRMIVLRDHGEEASLRLRGRRPHCAVEHGLVDEDWTFLTPLGEEVLSYHDSL